MSGINIKWFDILCHMSQKLVLCQWIMACGKLWNKVQCAVAPYMPLLAGI